MEEKQQQKKKIWFYGKKGNSDIFAVWTFWDVGYGYIDKSLAELSFKKIQVSQIGGLVWYKLLYYSLY